MESALKSAGIPEEMLEDIGLQKAYYIGKNEASGIITPTTREATGQPVTPETAGHPATLEPSATVTGKNNITGKDDSLGNSKVIENNNSIGNGSTIGKEIPTGNGSTTGSVNTVGKEVPASDVTPINMDETVKNLRAKLDQNLLKELEKSGVKYTPEDVVYAAKNTDGKLLWLETGNPESAGLIHIYRRHTDNFADKGITDIPGFMDEVIKTKPYKTGLNSRGYFARYELDGKPYILTYGTNGFIVSFYPCD